MVGDIEEKINLVWPKRPGLDREHSTVEKLEMPISQLVEVSLKGLQESEERVEQSQMWLVVLLESLQARLEVAGNLSSDGSRADQDGFERRCQLSSQPPERSGSTTCDSLDSRVKGILILDRNRPRRALVADYARLSDTEVSVRGVVESKKAK